MEMRFLPRCFSLREASARGFNRLEDGMAQRFDAVDTRFDALETRLDRFEARVLHRFDDIEGRLVAVESH
jgi:hypothetical protein